jgi:hypothetical protein
VSHARRSRASTPAASDRRVALTWIGLGAVGVVAVVLCILVFPGHIVDHDVGSSASSRLDPEAKLKATNDVRTTLLQGLAGAFFLATAFFTWRQIRVSQHQLRLSEQQQIAERFTKAVEQLAHKSLDVRLGGVFALEQIEHISEAYDDVIAEVLAAYVRGRAPWPALDLDAASPITPDVQAALTVLGRTTGARQSRDRPINLGSSDLREADLRDAVLPGVHFNESNLTRAHLDGAQLYGARLVNTDLRGAWLENVNLCDAKLIHAKLEGARLASADLRGADLTSATVNEQTRFIGTKLERAILRRVELSQARYGRLTWDDKTVWPDGFVLRDEIASGSPPPSQDGESTIP